MPAIEGEDASILSVASTPKTRRRRFCAAFVAVFTAQYTLVAMTVGLTVAGVLRYLVTPQIVAKFDAIEAALKRLPAL
jgi:hypothetical protein